MAAEVLNGSMTKVTAWLTANTNNSISLALAYRLTRFNLSFSHFYDVFKKIKRFKVVGWLILLFEYIAKLIEEIDIENNFIPRIF